MEGNRRECSRGEFGALGLGTHEAISKADGYKKSCLETCCASGVRAFLLPCRLFLPCTVSCSPSALGGGGLQKEDLDSMSRVSAGRWVSGQGTAGLCPGCSVGVGAVSPWRAGSVLTPHGYCCSIRWIHVPDRFGWEDSHCQGWRCALRCF